MKKKCVVSQCFMCKCIVCVCIKKNSLFLISLCVVQKKNSLYKIKENRGWGEEKVFV